VERFTAAIAGLFLIERLYGARKNSGFVSGHRFSDAVTASESDAPLGAGHRKSEFFSKLFSRRSHTARLEKVFPYPFSAAADSRKLVAHYGLV
jgi:hypothetical protein